MKRTLIAALLVTTTVTAFAAPRARREGRPGQRGATQQQARRAMAEVLGLSDAQKSQAQTLRINLRATIEPLRAQLRNNREAVKTAVDAGNAQEAGQLLVASKAIRDQIRAAHQNFESQFAAMLTADQKAKWSVMKELREARRDRRQHRGN